MEICELMGCGDILDDGELVTELFTVDLRFCSPSVVDLDTSFSG
jgi:hypothetical protein